MYNFMPRLTPLIAAMALLGAACTPLATPLSTSTPASTRPATSAGGLLRSAEMNGAPKVLHPYPEAQVFTSAWVDGATLIWANLIDVDWDKFEFVADPRRSMAREMPQVSNDGRTFTFRLRDDLKWSDGARITAADFEYAWQQASRKENNWINFGSTIERIESFKTPDSDTLEITLKEKLARYLAYSRVASIVPVPRHVWQDKSWLDATANPEIVKPTVVSGPYVPKELGAERNIYTRNPNWWGGKPNLDEIQSIFAGPNTTLELLKTRQVDWAHNFPPAQWEDAQKIAHANTWAILAGYRLMQFNLSRPNIKELKFRQALAHAINREDLVQFDEGLAEPQFGLYPNTSRYATDKVEKYAFDMNASKQLLQEAGYRLEGSTLFGANDQPVKIDMLWPTTSQPRGKMAAYAQQQWRRLGIDVEVTGLELNAFTDRYQRQKDFDIAMGSFGGGSGDPDLARFQLRTGETQNSTGYSNPRVDELFEAGAREQDDAKRKTIYDELQQVAVADLPQLYLVTYKNPTAMDKKIQNVKPSNGDDLLRSNNLQVLNWTVQSN